ETVVLGDQPGQAEHGTADFTDNFFHWCCSLYLKRSITRPKRQRCKQIDILVHTIAVERLLLHKRARCVHIRHVEQECTADRLLTIVDDQRPTSGIVVVLLRQHPSAWGTPITLGNAVTIPYNVHKWKHAYALRRIASATRWGTHGCQS